MSIATPDQDTRTLVVPDIDLALINEIDAAQACQWDTMFCTDIIPPCGNQATWLALFRSHCLHGGPLQPGDPMVCTMHKDYVTNGGDLACGGCGCPIKREGWKHFIISWTEIK
jgi:hypothetical protein